MYFVLYHSFGIVPVTILFTLIFLVLLIEIRFQCCLKGLYLARLKMSSKKVGFILIPSPHYTCLTYMTNNLFLCCQNNVKVGWTTTSDSHFVISSV